VVASAITILFFRWFARQERLEAEAANSASLAVPG
jgi:hypothetical protein